MLIFYIFLNVYRGDVHGELMILEKEGLIAIFFEVTL